MTSATSTIIDTITNDLKYKIAPFVICSDLTNHYITVCNMKNVIYYKSAKTLKYYRDTMKLNCKDFRNKLDQNLSQYFINCEVLNHLNYNIIFNDIVDAKQSTIDGHAPIRQGSTTFRRRPFRRQYLVLFANTNPKP